MRPWRIAMFVFGASAVVTMIATEIVRSVVDRKRTLRDGIGGTQDILMLGTLIAIAFIFTAIVCGIIMVEHRPR